MIVCICGPGIPSAQAWVAKVRPQVVSRAVGLQQRAPEPSEVGSVDLLPGEIADRWRVSIAGLGQSQD